MRIIVETVEKTDFFEIILTPKEIEKLPAKGITQEFNRGGKYFPLNVFVRQETDQEAEEAEEKIYAIEEWNQQKNHLIEYPRDGAVKPPTETGRRRGVKPSKKIRRTYS